MENQSEAIIAAKQPKLFKKAVVHSFVVIVITILCSVLVYFYYQNIKLQQILVQKESLSINTKPKQNLSVPSDVAVSIQNITNQLLENTIPFSASDSAVPVFTETFDLSQNTLWANQVITIYKYVPRGIIRQGYEGITWELHLDDEVTDLKKLSSYESGMHIIPPSSKKMAESNMIIVSVKKLGNVTVTWSDGYFRPSGSWSRNFKIFDQKRNQLLFISMNIRPESQDYSDIKEKSICFEHQCTVLYIFPPEIENFFQEQQDILLGALAKESLIRE